jgi:calcineurin-like phosphoesterase family protein
LTNIRDMWYTYNMEINYFLSDPHFTHNNILSFMDEEGKLLRGSVFNSIEEHDDTIIENINKRVRVQDKLYLLGDICFKKIQLPILNRINTKKLYLIRGNHDVLDLKEYLPYFRDIRAYKILPQHKLCFSHIPIHTESLKEGWFNIHGHLHHKSLEDKRYINISAEQINYTPISLEEIIEKIKEINQC